MRRILFFLTLIVGFNTNILAQTLAPLTGDLTQLQTGNTHAAVTPSLLQNGQQPQQSNTTKPANSNVKTITAKPLTKGTYTSSNGAILILPNVLNTHDSIAQKNGTNNTLLPNQFNNNNFTALTQNQGEQQNSNSSVNSLTNTLLSSPSQTNQNANSQPLPPLTSLLTPNYSSPNTNVIGGVYANSNLNDNYPNNTSGNFGSQQPFVMPPLATIPNNQNQPKASTYSMPGLAPIQGNENNNSNSNTTMPALAPIENGGGGQTIAVPELAPIKSTNLKGFVLPKGTLLNAKTGTTYTVKPLTQEEMSGGNEKTGSETQYKPGAGGGMGMPALSPIEEDNVIEKTPELAPIENVEIANKNIMPELAPIEPGITQQQQPVIPRKILATGGAPAKKSVVATTNTSKANPCIHVDGTYCPCCVKKPATKWKHKVKKWKPKKSYTSVAPTYVAPVQKPVIIKPHQNVVYKPEQQPSQQETTNQPQPQKQQEKVVFTDYTKAYYKEPEKQNCACPQGTNTGSSANNPQKYYNPSKYSGVSAGPTSGDYAANDVKVTDAPLRYKFYVNTRGKYSVEIYNNLFSIFLSQDGTFKDYRLNGDAASEKPKTNYFGKPESLAGTPIVYNYNRSVNKVGSIKLDYDFEGFIKNINNSPVLYTSRSSLASVDGTRVMYDGSGNVTGVDGDTQLIQSTGN